MPDNQHQQISNEEDKNEITEYYEGVKQLEMQGYESGIKNARTALFVTAALLFAGELISAAISEVPFTFLFWIIILIRSGSICCAGFLDKNKTLCSHCNRSCILYSYLGIGYCFIRFQGSSRRYHCKNYYHSISRKGYWPGQSMGGYKKKYITK